MPEDRGHSAAAGFDLFGTGLDGDGFIIHTEGELDLANCEAWREELERVIEGTNGVVVLDLARCEFMDSAGLCALIQLARLHKEKQRELAITGLKGQPKRLFEVTGTLDSGLFALDGSGG